MTRSANEAVRASLAARTNVPGSCQGWTHRLFEPNGSLAVGDYDGDGDADAVDGWKREPAGAKHTDRKPPRGAPVAWSGGRNGYGHRALSLGPDSKGVYWIRTTDGDGPGKVATRTLGWVEQTWGLTYLGWSETISGQQIPGLIVKAPEPVKPPKPKPPRMGVIAARRFGVLSLRFAKLAASRLAKSKDPVLRQAAAEFTETANRNTRTLSRMPKK